MGKVLKTVLTPIRLIIGDKAADILVGVALVVAGVVTGNFQLIAAGVSIGSSALASKPKPPRASASDRNRLFASINPRAPRTMVFGRTAMATDIRDQEFTGTDKEYLHRFIVVASHKCQAIEQIWFDDKLAWNGTVQSEFAGYLTVTPILEGNAGNAINISARMGTTRRYTGCAYVHLRYKLTGNSKKSDSPFAQSIPSRMTIIGKGIACYDPRLDTTVGGSGSQRANDQSTWVWNDSASRNTKLQELTYLLGWRINGKLAVGKGVPPARIDIASYITAANACDETVSLAAGGTEPRYRSDGVVNESDDMSIVLDQLKSSSNSLIDDADGKIRTLVLSNDLGSPVAAFGADDIIGNAQWKPFSDLADRFNIVRGTYTDPSTNSLYQSVEYPEVALASTDGVERTYTVDYPMVQSASQAQRLAKQRLQRAQYGGILTCQMQSTAWRVQKNDVITLTFAPLGFTNKLFRLVATTVRIDGIVDVTLREENAAVYAWDMNESAPVTAAAPTTYSYTDNPLYQDLSTLPTYTITPPGADGGVGHLFVDGTGKKYRFSSAALTFGGSPLTFNGDPIYTSGYEDAQDQASVQALEAATIAQSAAALAIGLAGDAQATADGKVQTYYQASAPIAEGVGDLWFDTDDGNKQYRWSGSAWLPVQDAGIGQAITNAAGAQATADGKVTTFVSETAPTASALGDLWFKVSTGELKRWNGSTWGSTLVDLTSVSQVTASMLPDKNVGATYLGVVSADNLAALSWTPDVVRGGVSMRGDNSVSYVISGPYGGTFAVDNTNGSSTKGRVTISAITASVAGGNLDITVGGVPLPSLPFKVTKILAAAPSAPSGTDSKSWTSGDFNSLNLTSFVAISTVKTLALVSGQSLYGTAPLDYYVSGSTTTSRTMSPKWQYSVAGANSWNDFAAAITGSSALSGSAGGPPDYDVSAAEPGSVAVTQTKSGLGTGSYDVRLVAQLNNTGRTVTVDGSALMEAKT